MEIDRIDVLVLVARSARRRKTLFEPEDLIYIFSCRLPTARDRRGIDPGFALAIPLHNAPATPALFDALTSRPAKCTSGAINGIVRSFIISIHPSVIYRYLYSLLPWRLIALFLITAILPTRRCTRAWTSSPRRSPRRRGKWHRITC